MPPYFHINNSDQYFKKKSSQQRVQKSLQLRSLNNRMFKNIKVCIQEFIMQRMSEKMDQSVKEQSKAKIEKTNMSESEFSLVSL